MSTIKSSDEHLTLNADGSSKDIKFQANGVEKASISSAGAFTSTTIDATKLTGNLPAISAASLTNIPAANITGTLPAIDGSNLTGVGIAGIDDQSSSNDDQITIKDSEIVFNEDGDDLDFRLEGQGRTNCVYFNGDSSKWTFGGAYSFDNTFSINCDGASGGQVRSQRTSGTNKQHMSFYNGSTYVGEINSNTGTTTYTTSSDYRLKENVDYTWDATTRLKQLKPARFNFIADDTNTLVDGFIAHEVSSIVPEAIVGDKDAVNEDGDIKPQGIDQSKLVPLLVKTIQELEARITALEA